MPPLSTPDEHLAARVLREVDYEQRLFGYRLRQRMGPTPEPLYSFEEVVHLLDDKSPYVNPEQLQQWVTTVTKDPELAAAIAAAIKEESNDVDRIARIGVLMGERLCQCKQAVSS